MKNTEMEYCPKRIRKILATGYYLGYQYYILNLGNFPTAYIKIPENHKYFNIDYDEINIECHGGLTYGSNHLIIDEEGKKVDGWFIGWDYGHAGDYICFENFLLRLSAFDNNDKKYTTEEILKEVKYVCRQLMEVENEKN